MLQRHVMAWMVSAATALGGWASTVQATEIVDPGFVSPWVIESADYTGAVRDQIARLEARYTIQVMRDGWVEIPLSLQGATITDIALEKKSGEAHLVPRAGLYVLVAQRKGTYKVRMTCSALLAQDSQFEGLQFGIPRATFSTLTVEVPRKEVELRQTDQLYVEAHPDAQHDGVKLTARLGAADRVDLRWRTKPASPVTVEPVLYGAVNTMVTVEEQLARLISIIDYRMAQGETRELVVRLPAGVNVLNVRGSGIEDWRVVEASDQKTLTVALGAPLKDAVYRLIVEGEQTIEGASTSYTLPGLQLVNAKQERGYLAVSRSGSIELAPQTVDGINRVDVKELPDLMRTAGDSPAILAFKYHQHPYRVTLALTRHQDHPVLAAIAERGELATILSRQGELLTRATYLIRANKKQFLEVLLPGGATLWSCLVGGKSVKPVEGTDGKLLVPMDTATDAAQAVSVELVYFERRPELTRIGHLKLQGPILDVPTTVANWFVYAPREIKFLRMSGNLERGAAVADFLDEPFIQVASAATRPQSSSVMFSRVAEKPARMVQSPDRIGELKDLEGSYDEAAREVADFALQGAVAMSGGRDDKFEQVVVAMADRFQETGILPLKIRLPKAGTVYRFNRLMTTQDALRLDATFVHLKLPWVPFAALGIIMLPIAGLVATRFPRR